MSQTSDRPAERLAPGLPLEGDVGWAIAGQDGHVSTEMVQIDHAARDAVQDRFRLTP